MGKEVLADIQKLTTDDNERVSQAALETVSFLKSIDADPDPGESDRPTEKVGQADDSPGELPPLIPQLAAPAPEEAAPPENPEPAAPAVPKKPDTSVDEPIDEE